MRFLVVLLALIILTLLGSDACLLGFRFALISFSAGFFGEAGKASFHWLRQRRGREQQANFHWADVGGGAVLLVRPGVDPTLRTTTLSGVDRAGSDDKNVKPRP